MGAVKDEIYKCEACGNVVLVLEGDTVMVVGTGVGPSIGPVSARAACAPRQAARLTAARCRAPGV
jgi:hypothetical protein